MNETSFVLKQLDGGAAAEIKELFVSVFTQEPWNDDWSDKAQLQAYLRDLCGQENSLTFGLYDGDDLAGVSMGRVKHWYTGTEYCIDELCIRTSLQGKGVGTLFVSEISKTCKQLGMKHIFLLTEDNVPAFGFYKKLGFHELEHSTSLAKNLYD